MASTTDDVDMLRHVVDIFTSVGFDEVMNQLRTAPTTDGKLLAKVSKNGCCNVIVIIILTDCFNSYDCYNMLESDPFMSRVCI